MTHDIRSILDGSAAFTNGARAHAQPVPPKSSAPAESPAHVWPEWARRYFDEVAAACEVPADVVRFVGLGVLSAAYGTHCQVALKSGYTRYCHDYFMLSADVSIGKSPIFSYLAKPLYSIQAGLRLAAEQVAEDEANPKNIPPAPVVVINDATPEALVHVQSQNGGAAAMVSAETPLIAQLSNVAKPWPLAPYNASHTGEPYHVHRITRGANEVEKARLAIVAATQPGVLRSIHRRPDLAGSGFLARINFYIARPLTLDDLNGADPIVSVELQERWQKTVDTLGMYYRRKDRRLVLFSREAAEARVAWLAMMRRRYKLPDGDLYDLRAYCGKLEEKVARWATLLHVLHCNDEARDAGELTLKDWQRGLALYESALAHYDAAQTLIAESAVEALIAAVRVYCARHGGRITFRELGRGCAAWRDASVEDREAAVDALEEDQVVVRVDGRRGNTGRPSPALEVL